MRRRREIGGTRCYKPWKDWSEGDYIVGEYTGSSVDSYDKTNWHIKLEKVVMQDPVTSRDQELVAGMILGLNSAGTLDVKMQEVEVGAIVEIMYNGKEILPENHKYKNKECHQISVAVLEGEETSDTDLV